MLLYPNPATGLVHVGFIGKLPDKVVISDVMGRELIEYDVIDANGSIDIQNIPAGVYFVSVITDGSIIESQKLVVPDN